MANIARSATIPDPGSTESAKMHREDVVHDIPAPENKKFYPALDGLRAIAVLMVFHQHYLGGSEPAFAWGWSGVDFFFVLSGFLITGILYDTRHAAHRFRDFYVRRTLRIFPLYYGALLIGLLLEPIFRWEWHASWILWPLYLGNYARFIWLPHWRPGGGIEHLLSTRFTHQPFLLLFGHFWSLCVEEQFYLVWPMVVFFLKDRIRLRNLCFLICGLSLAARVVGVFVIPRPYLEAEILYRLTPFRADALLLGGALALMLRGPEWPRLQAILKPAFVLFVAGFVLFESIYSYNVGHAYYAAGGAPVLSTLGYTLLDLFSAIVILLALEPSGLIYRMMTVKPLRRLGQVSYGFYVFHDIPHIFYARVIAHFLGHSVGYAFLLLTAATGLCCTLVLAFLSFRFYEAPFLRLKKKFAP